MATIHEEQQQWQQEKQAKIKTKQKQQIADQMNECSFSPKLSTSTRLSQMSPSERIVHTQQNHIRRQVEARIRKNLQPTHIHPHALTSNQGNFIPKQTNMHNKFSGSYRSCSTNNNMAQTMSSTMSSLNMNTNLNLDMDMDMNSPQPTPNTPPLPPDNNNNNNNNNNLNEDQDFTYYEILQNERQAWAEERARLISVIEIQQTEIHKRTSGNQNKAIEVARSFGDAIGVFEQRLLGVEQGVLNELKLLRSRITATQGEARLTEIDTSVKELSFKMASFEQLLGGRGSSSV